MKLNQPLDQCSALPLKVALKVQSLFSAEQEKDGELKRAKHMVLCK